MKKLYFPTNQSDLALNFLEVQIENPWEQSALYVKEEKPKNTIRYRHNDEGLYLIIKPSRMTKEGAFRDLDKTYNLLMQLYNLDDSSSRKKYIHIHKNKRSKKKKTLTINPLEGDLIYENYTDSEILTPEDSIECKTKAKVYHLSAPEYLDTAAGRMWTAAKLKIFSPPL